MERIQSALPDFQDQPRANVPVVMPASADETPDGIEHIGVEGRAGDPRAGPARLFGELAAAFLIILVLVGVTAWILGWAAGAVGLAFATIAFILNPEVGATLVRAADRRKVAHQHESHTINHPPPAPNGQAHGSHQ